MSYRAYRRVWTCLLAGILGVLMTTSVEAGSRRRAVVAGNNYGGSQRIPLRYAEEDARRMVRVLRELGQFPEDHIQLLAGSSPGQLLDSVRRAESEDQADSGEGGSLLLVFFSGHADGINLLMGEEKLGIVELKQAMAAARSDVVLLILDACKVGTAIHTKGGRSAPSFLRFSDSPRANGKIILTSASASELAQESDEIGSSFFTHYLVSGLMGDADSSGDRRVSLSELYSYVYDRTVHRTVDTLPGVQHPTFSYQLSGEGNIVLTDLNNESTGVVLPEATAGNYLLFDRNRRSVVAELEKKAGERRLIPLSPGNYTLKKRLKDHLLVAEVMVAAGERVAVYDQTMQVVPFEYPTAKGWDLVLRSRPSRWELQAVTGWTAFARAPAGGVWSFPSAGVALRRQGWPARSWTTRLAASAGAWEHTLPLGDLRLPFTLFQLGTDFSLGRSFEYGPLLAEVGGRATVLFIQRRFDDGGFIGTDQTLGAGAGPYLLASLYLGRVRLAVELSAGALLFPAAEHVVVPAFSGGLAVGFGL